MDTKFKYCSPEVWGGIECTINRIQDTWLDQLETANHYKRPGDIDKIAELGIRALRYPVLWEKHQPDQDTPINWTWISHQLNKIRSYGIKPIAGLLHHGSGPAFTNLADKHFPAKLAAYAGNVAAQFPWIEYYTPVNEPLTTARFSGLYGYWYPHKSDDRNFVKILLNQVMGIVLSMKAIRKINPEAKLIQTEDLAKTYSSSSLQYQANFENDRRWISNDLLCGKVDSDHHLWDYLIQSGATEESLQFFLENPCPPDILGFNYYVTSERFLDDDIYQYPSHMHGGNGIEKYVDTEAVRVPHSNPSGVATLLTEAWERYNIPMALTEVHLHCSREDQLRWFNEIYNTATCLANTGIPVMAVTAWSVLGAYGWNRLLTEPGGDYEPGVFDLSGGDPRPTALAELIKAKATDSANIHPVITENGWWKQNSRFLYHSSARNNHPLKTLHHNPAPILIISRNGKLANAFAHICNTRGISHILVNKRECDLCNPESIKSVINKYKPWAIINAAGYTRIDSAENDAEQCFTDNVTGPGILATICRLNGIKLLTFSSDLVFDGGKTVPYIEDDLSSPLSVYGLSKVKKEELVQKNDPDALIIRTSTTFGPWQLSDYAQKVITSVQNGKKVVAADDVIISPTYIPDLVNAAMDLLIDNEKMVWHLTNDGELSWYDFAIEIARSAGLSSSCILHRNIEDMHLAAPRPVYSVLRSSKGIFLPRIEKAFDRFAQDKNHMKHIADNNPVTI